MFQFFMFIIIVGLIGCDSQLSTGNGTIGLRDGDAEKYYQVVTRLQSILLKDYNKDIRPAVSHDQPLNVRVRLTLTHFDLDERKSTFTAQCWLHREWIDARLQWNPSEYEGLQAMHIPSSAIWKPDFTLYNNAEASNHNLESEIPAIVDSNGTVSWFPGSTYVALCNVNAAYWPFDVQTCSLNMGSWAHDGFEISFSVAENGTKKSDISIFADNQQWKILYGEATFDERFYTCCQAPYHFVDFSFKLKRVAASFGATFIIPGLVIILLTLSSFFLPPNCSTKILLALMDFVVVVVYLLHLSSILPPMGTAVPYIVSFYSATLVLIGLSITFNITTMRWLRLPQTDSPPACIQSILSGIVGRILLVGYSPPKIYNNTRDTIGADRLESGMENESDTKCIMEKENGSIHSLNIDWLTLVVALDRLAFVIYCFAFIIFGFAFL